MNILRDGTNVSYIVAEALFSLKAPNKNCSRRHFKFLLLTKKIRLNFSGEFSSRIHLKYQMLFFLKKKKKKKKKRKNVYECRLLQS